MLKYKYSDISKTGSNPKDLDSISESIDNIMKTRIGERPFNRAFGSRIEDYLFKPLSFSIGRLILSEIISSVSKWEDRVELLPETNVSINPDTRKYSVVILVKVKGLDGNLTLTKTLTPKG